MKWNYALILTTSSSPVLLQHANTSPSSELGTMLASLMLCLLYTRLVVTNIKHCGGMYINGASASRIIDVKVRRCALFYASWVLTVVEVISDWLSRHRHKDSRFHSRGNTQVVSSRRRIGCHLTRRSCTIAVYSQSSSTLRDVVHPFIFDHALLSTFFSLPYIH